MKQGIIDRFEDDIAVIEIDGHTEDVLRNLVENNARSGDVVMWTGVKWIVHEETTLVRRKQIRKMMDEVWNSTKDNEGI